MHTEPRIPDATPLDDAAVARLDPKQRMVVTAAKLFQRQGYHATGLKQVVTEAQAPRGSIYHHFPGGKEELGVEAVRVAAAELTRAIRRATDAGDAPADVVRRFGRALGRWLTESEYFEGCPVSTVTLETAPESAPLTEACASAYAEWVRLFAELLRDGGVAEPDADALATLTVSAVEGALLLCRAARSTTAMTDVTEQVATLIESRIQARTAPV